MKIAALIDECSIQKGDVMNYSVTIEPVNVAVNDERGSVPGIYVQVSSATVVTGTVIPIEGDSIDCWAELRLCRALPRDLLLQLGADAAEGRTQEYEWESDEPALYASSSAGR